MSSTILNDIKQSVYSRVIDTGFDYSKYEKYNFDYCNLCNGKSLRLYSHQDRYGLPVRSMQCNHCGLIFITPRMSLPDYDLFYDQWYRKLVSAFNGYELTEEQVMQSRNGQADQMVSFLGEHLPDHFEIKTMLDIGGSIGVFADKVCKVTCAIGTVIDPNSVELSEASKRGLNCIEGSFESYKPQRTFDLVSMLRTVEHLQDIKSSIQKVGRILNEGGVFLIDIVNHQWLVKHFKSNTLSTKIDHVYQLTNKTISLYFERCGFEIIGNSSLDERYISYLLVKVRK